MGNPYLTPTLSVVIPVLNEEENLPPLITRLKDITKKFPSENFEFIFVDDGSADHSFQKLKEFSGADGRIKALKLCRNFGSHNACLAGLSQAQGNRMIIMAADMQDPPELIEKLIQAQQNGIQVVWAVRGKREDSKMTLFFSRLYNEFMRRYIFPQWPGEGADVVLFTRRVRDALLACPEKNTSVFAQIFWFGFPQTSIYYTKGKRLSGKSKWTFSKRLKFGIDSVLSFSFLPIRMISYLGILLTVLGFLCLGTILTLEFFSLVQVPGWSPLMIAIFLTSGLQLLMLGIIGEYLWRAADQLKARPFYIVTQEFGFDSNSRNPYSSNSLTPAESLTDIPAQAHPL